MNLRSSFDHIEKAALYISLSATFIIFLLTAADTFGRYIFSNPILVAFDLTTVLMVCLFSFALATSVSTRVHVRMAGIYSMLPKAIKPWLDSLHYIIVLMLYGAIAWQTGITGWQYLGKTDFFWSVVLPLPRGIMFLVLSFGALLMVIRILIMLINRVPSVETREGQL